MSEVDNADPSGLVYSDSAKVILEKRSRWSATSYMSRCGVGVVPRSLPDTNTSAVGQISDSKNAGPKMLALKSNSNSIESAISPD